eukprot:471288-Prorocentrum_minimum.AAC.1
MLTTLRSDARLARCAVARLATLEDVYIRHWRMLMCTRVLLWWVHVAGDEIFKYKGCWAYIRGCTPP